MKKLLAMMIVMAMLTGCAEETTKEKPVVKEKEKTEQKSEQKPEKKKTSEPKGAVNEAEGIKIQAMKEIFRKKDDIILVFTNTNDIEVTGNLIAYWEQRMEKVNEQPPRKITLKPGETVEINLGNVEVDYVELFPDQALPEKVYLRFSTIWHN